MDEESEIEWVIKWGVKGTLIESLSLGGLRRCYLFKGWTTATKNRKWISELIS